MDSMSFILEINDRYERFVGTEFFTLHCSFRLCFVCKVWVMGTCTQRKHHSHWLPIYTQGEEVVLRTGRHSDPPQKRLRLRL